jgi:hypothetical protein
MVGVVLGFGPIYHPSYVVSIVTLAATAVAGVGLLLSYRWAWPLALALVLYRLVDESVGLFHVRAVSWAPAITPSLVMLAGLLTPRVLRWVEGRG